MYFIIFLLCIQYFLCNFFQILYLENLRCKGVPESNYRTEKNLDPFELAVTTSTGIEFLGIMKDTFANAQAIDVDFKTIMKNLNKKGKKIF